MQEMGLLNQRLCLHLPKVSVTCFHILIYKGDESVVDKLLADNQFINSSFHLFCGSPLYTSCPDILVNFCGWSSAHFS